MNAVSSIDKLNAAKRLQQTLGKNPNDIHALLELATLLGTFKDPDLDKKRKLLNRILTLDPVNKTAREMLVQMDRAELTGGYSQAASSIPIVQQPESGSSRSSNDQLAKPLIFRYSIVHQIFVYLLIAFTVFTGVNIINSVSVLLVVGVFLLFLIIPLWFVSAVVEVSGAGIKLTRLFGVYRREVEWTKINRIQPAIMGVGMKLTSAEEISVTISSQMHRYPAIVEILRRIRPDLFDTAGAKIFRKGFFSKYGLFFFLIPASLMTPGAVLVPPFVPGILFAVVLFFMWRYALYTIHQVKVEENKLSIQSFRESHVLTAQQIKDISIISVRNRRGVAKNLIQVELDGESYFRLSGFAEGNEIMYGLLRNWWGSYRTS